VEHRQFVDGMRALSLGKAAPEPTVDQLEVYWRVLESLTPEQWAYAVRETLTSPDRWIPSAGELLHCGRELRSQAVAFLPQDTRTPEQRQADAIETSRRLREIVGAAPPEWPKAKGAPSAEPIKVNVTDERLAELRAQAERIKLEDGAKAS
jgi:hypothetical protein